MVAAIAVLVIGGCTGRWDWDDAVFAAVILALYAGLPAALLAWGMGQVYVRLAPRLSRTAAARRARAMAYAEEYEALTTQRLSDLRTRERRERAQQRRRESFWTGLDGPRFEQEMCRLFRLKGYRAETTPASGDEGIDIVLDTEGAEVLVQCKAHKAPVGPGPVRELYGVLVDQAADEAMLVSVGGFTDGARKFAAGKPIRLLDLRDILQMATLSRE